jgi:hypothetical protein
MEEKFDRGHALDENTNRKLLSALHGLAAQTRAATPPDDLEARLLARAETESLLADPQAVSATPRHVLPRRPQVWFQWPRWAWAPVAAAALALLIFAGARLWQGSDSTVPSLPQQVAVTPSPTAPPSPAPSVSNSAVQPLPSKASVDAGRTRRVRRRPEPRPAPPVTIASSKPAGSTPATASPSVADSPEAVGEFTYSAFVPLSTAPELRMDEFAQTVRVRVEQEDLWRFGLPVPATRPSARGGQDGRVLADFLVGEDGRPRAIRLVSTAQE